MKKNNFNWIAPIYNWLTRLAFFGRIQKSHSHWLKEIPEESIILILGGGSGAFLKELHSKKCSIVYVEKSSGMIKKAKKNTDELAIEFICEDFLTTNLSQNFDVVITHFFLDVFYDRNFFKVVDKVKKSLNNNGIWLVADFEDNGEVAWKKTMLRMMFLFFRITANLETNKLLPIRVMIARRGFKEMKLEYFYRKFIFSSIFRKA